MAIEDVAIRAEGYGFPGVTVDGNDVLACYGAMKAAHDRARAGEGPTLIECKTYRFLGHTSDDDDKTYRSRDEVEAARGHDPVHVFGEYMRTNGILDDLGTEEMRLAIKTQIDEALARAWEAADPTPGSALRHVFAEPEPHP
jgi:2-oxoisovalerate dehydrogenase E1 component alpha subunit